MTFPHTFGPLPGPVPLSYLDENFSKIELKGSGGEMEPQISVDISGKQLEAVRLKFKGADNFGGTVFGFTEKQYPFGRRKVLNDAGLNAIKPFIAELGQKIISPFSHSVRRAGSWSAIRTAQSDK